MRILMVSECIQEDREGGDCRFVSSLSHALAHAGHEVRVITRRMHPEDSSCGRIGSVVVHRFPAPRLGSRVYFTYPLASCLGALQTYLRVSRRWRPDIVHVHHPYSAVGIILAARLFRRKLPRLVLTFHSPKAAEYDAAYSRWNPLRKMIKCYAQAVERTTTRGVDAVVVLSGFMEDQLLLHCSPPASKIHKIPGGVDLDVFHPPADKSAVRNALGIPEAGPVFFTARRLVRRMGIGNLIVAFHSVPREHPAALLLIGGRGPLEEELRRQVANLHLEDNVRFLGFVLAEELPKYYQASDCFVLPTEKLEGFGLVILEAFACGTPVLGTAIGAIPEVIGMFDASLIVPSPSPSDLAVALDRVIRQLGHGGYPGHQYRSVCEREFGWEIVAKRYVQLFRDLATEHGSESLDGAPQYDK